MSGQWRCAPLRGWDRGEGGSREGATDFVISFLGAVEGVAHERVARVSLGERHGCEMTESDSLYVWGDDVSKFKKI